MSTVSNEWVVSIEVDPNTGELVMPIPVDVINIKSWKDGDILEWISNFDGSWTIEKIKD